MGLSENKVTEQVRTFLEEHGYLVFRMQSGRFRGAGGWITMNPKGTPDLLAIHKGTQSATFIETKTKDGKANKDQKRFQNDYRALGGTSLIVHSRGDLIQQLGFEQI
jgi:hypothetical protein